MKRIVLFLAIAVIFASCAKQYDESLTICLANAYDQTVLVDWLYPGASPIPVKSGAIHPVTLCGASGYGNHLDVPSLWKQFFYDKYNAPTISTADGTVIKVWTKEDTSPGTPFNLANWSSEDKVESGIDVGLKEGIEYIFMVSAYTYTMYNLTFVLAPGKE